MSAPHPLPMHRFLLIRHGHMNLLPNPDEAVVVVPVPKPKAEDAVVLAPNEPNEPNEKPDEPLFTTDKTETHVRRMKTSTLNKYINHAHLSHTHSLKNCFHFMPETTHQYLQTFMQYCSFCFSVNYARLYCFNPHH